MRQLVTSWLTWISIVCKNHNIVFGAERVNNKRATSLFPVMFILFVWGLRHWITSWRTVNACVRIYGSTVSSELSSCIDLLRPKSHRRDFFPLVSLLMYYQLNNHVKELNYVVSFKLVTWVLNKQKEKWSLGFSMHLQRMLTICKTFPESDQSITPITLI